MKQLKWVCIVAAFLALIPGIVGCAEQNSAPTSLVAALPTQSDVGRDLRLVYEENGPSEVRRRYRNGAFKLWTSATQFPSEQAAQERLLSVRKLLGQYTQTLFVSAAESSWKPKRKIVNEYVLAEYREMVEPDTGKPSVGYDMSVRVGKVVLYVGGEDYGAYFDPRVGGVVGNPRWLYVEGLMDIMIAKYEDAQGQ